MNRRLTEINGLTLNSELEDKDLYSKIRSLQFLFLHTYHLGSGLKITESKINKHYYYAIQNTNAGLMGFVGRDSTTNGIRYLIKDKSRIQWMVNEGFELTEENFNKVGVMAKCKGMGDFILFMAGKQGYEFTGYARSN